MLDLLIINGLVYIDHQYERVNIGIKDEKIVYLGDEKLPSKEIYDVQGKKVIPGLIDPHVHFALNCGTVTSRDDFYSGTKCAAYGGVTTIIDFLDPSRNVEELEQTFLERKEIAKGSNVDYHFHACIKEPNGDLESYVKRVKELGMSTIKLFTTYSETHRRTYDEDIIKLLELSKKYDVIVLAHIENDEMINHDPSLKCTDIAKARPAVAETSEALKLCEFAKKTGGYLYMVHCSSGDTLRRIVEQYKDYLNKNIFVESCPQYFYLDDEALSREDGYLFTFAPPLRNIMERRLIEKYKNYLCTIGTDHCSFTSEDKKTHPMLAGHPLGVGGIESVYQLMQKMYGDTVIDKMCYNTAKIEKIALKNGIKVGNFADLVVVEDKEVVIGKPHGNVDYSIYEGITVNQDIISTLSRGHFVIKDKAFHENEGKLIDCSWE